MTLIKRGRNLTSPNPELDQQASRTHDGMAHLAGTGPKGRTCRECIHWDHRGYSGGVIEPAPCKKFRQLTHGRRGARGKAVPDYVPACKYFEVNEKAPKRFG